MPIAHGLSNTKHQHVASTPPSPVISGEMIPPNTQIRVPAADIVCRRRRSTPDRNIGDLAGLQAMISRQEPWTGTFAAATKPLGKSLNGRASDSDH